MPVLIVVGAQWGDEGKGAMVDSLARDADIVVRFQGGANAGHTVIYGGEPLALHLLPAGITHPHTVCVLGNGVVLDLHALLDEIAAVRQRGIAVDPERLKISDRAHLTLPYHRLLDAARERAGSTLRLGTTRRGVGPTYVDKVDRVGLRAGDLRHPDRLREKLLINFEHKRAFFNALPSDERPDVDAILDELLRYAELLHPYIADTVTWLNAQIAAGKRLLLEGAQGTGLDVDFGTYPFVTSSNTTAGGACTGSGIPPTKISAVLGIAKAYTTRVGDGPFPTELPEQEQTALREKGREYGATTGRPRRCGWFDAVLARYAAQVNGFTALAVTKLDVLSGFPEVKLSVAYRWRNEVLTAFPAEVCVLNEVEPVYETLPGWDEPLNGLRSWKQLPANARRFLDRVSELTQTPIAFVSVGPERDAVLFAPDAPTLW
ncbi:Adenylosuccinate synthetase [bacterium HR17]|uniref:Adenylosuccinate synthetase n=1 Tax=Candidatus Fervidibacter japonicus TaxID=2035412 RepID=A0A2H5XAC5_9BACT|nr:Adenylosuccinate synthetase [bacterium HR17]